MAIRTSTRSLTVSDDQKKLLNTFYNADPPPPTPTATTSQPTVDQPLTQGASRGETVTQPAPTTQPNTNLKSGSLIGAGYDAGPSSFQFDNIRALPGVDLGAPAVAVPPDGPRTGIGAAANQDPNAAPPPPTEAPAQESIDATGGYSPRPGADPGRGDGTMLPGPSTVGWGGRGGEGYRDARDAAGGAGAGVGGTGGGDIDAMIEAWLRGNLGGTRDTSEEEALLRQAAESMMGQGVVDARARMGRMGFGASGAMGALEGDIRTQAARELGQDVFDLRRDARQEELERARAAMQGAFTMRGLDQGDARQQAIMDMYREMMNEGEGGDEPGDEDPLANPGSGAAKKATSGMMEDIYRMASEFGAPGSKELADAEAYYSELPLEQQAAWTTAATLIGLTPLYGAALAYAVHQSGMAADDFLASINEQG